MIERRRAPRVEPVGRLMAKCKASLPARIIDISTGGALVEVACCLNPQVSCDLRVDVGNEEIVVRATVRRCRVWAFALDEADRRVLFYRAGLEFGEIAEPVLAKLILQVPGLAAQAPAAPGLDVDAPAAGTPPAAPPPPHSPGRTAGPVKVRIDVEQIRRRTGDPEPS
jgi:PilZ domain